MERRLAAILSADVVGYSRLIRTDEEGTLAAFKALRRDCVDPKVAEHHGRIFKLTGDGILAEFGSAVEAVRAACEMQESLAAFNAEIPADRRIALRMGLNLGDVVIDGDDIQGDGVNVAARLEGLAEPGGLCISGNVYEEVRDRTPYAFNDMGDQRVKNIDRPVRVYRLAQGAAHAARAHGPHRPGHWAKGLAVAGALVAGLAVLYLVPAGTPPTAPGAVPSVAVAPFEIIGAAPGQTDFVAGLTEDLRITLAGETGLAVVSQEVVADTAAARKALYLVEGSVRQAGERLRITASLISADTGVHLWGGRYDRAAGDLLTVQEEVASKIAAGLSVKLADEEAVRQAGDTRPSMLWAGLAQLGRIGERTIAYTWNTLGGGAGGNGG